MTSICILVFLYIVHICYKVDSLFKSFHNFNHFRGTRGGKNSQLLWRGQSSSQSWNTTHPENSIIVMRLRTCCQNILIQYHKQMNDSESQTINDS